MLIAAKFFMLAKVLVTDTSGQKIEINISVLVLGLYKIFW